MHRLPLYTAEQSRHCDQALIASGIDGFVLMTRAATAAWQKAKLMVAGIDQPEITVFCGMGNNGGDGLVLAALAKDEGYAVQVYLAADPNRYKGEAADAYAQAMSANVEMKPLAECADYSADLIVDALLGTGLSSAVRDPYLTAIKAINQTRSRVLAIDVPSGICADSGAELGVAVHADCTISFIVRKQGLYTGKGLVVTGEYLFDDLVTEQNDHTELSNYRQILDGVDAPAELVGLQALMPSLPPRVLDANKGAYGHSLLIGGNHGMCGAIMLASEAAARTGSGLTSVATREENAQSIVIRTPEIMSRGVESIEALSALLARATVIGIGPGLGSDSWATLVYREAVASSLPLVVDADALNNIASGLVDAPELGRWIMCPHPKEAARLLGCEVADIEADRFAAARRLRDQYGAVVVLKGAGTLVLGLADATETRVQICPYGNPGMASGGMGDVLTGIITALVAQGLSLSDAAALGVSLHARAGDNAAKSTGQCGLLASDLITPLMRLLP